MRMDALYIALSKSE